MLILGTGCLKISSFSSEGDELVFSRVLPGEIIGELGILSNVPRSATVTALQRSSALTLSRSVVMELIEKRPAVAVAMLQHMADKVRRTTGVAADLVFLGLSSELRSSYLKKRLNRRTKYGPLKPNWPQPLAQAANVSTPVSRSFREMSGFRWRQGQFDCAIRKLFGG